jgi:hypothetical protein
MTNSKECRGVAKTAQNGTWACAPIELRRLKKCWSRQSFRAAVRKPVERIADPGATVEEFIFALGAVSGGAREPRSPTQSTRRGGA